MKLQTAPPPLRPEGMGGLRLGKYVGKYIADRYPWAMNGEAIFAA